MEQTASNSIPLYSLYGQLDVVTCMRFIHLESLYERNRFYDWNIRPHRHHDLRQLIWVAEGHGVVALEDETLELEAPILINVPPTLVHGFQWVPTAKGLVLTLAESFVEDIVKLLNDSIITESLRSLLVITGNINSPSLERLHNLFAVIVEEYINNKVGRKTAITGNIMMLFSELARLRNLNVQPIEDINKNGTTNICKNFQELVNKHYHEHWSVTKYAKALSMTERNLRRLCNDGLGLSPKQVIDRRLYKEAKRRLIYTNNPINKVGYDLGFNDPNYFTKFFTRHSNETPQEFRNRRVITSRTV